MAWVEILSKRGRKSKHFLDEQTGKFYALLDVDDLHYHDGAAWQDIDENLADDGLDGYDHKADKVRHVIRLANSSGRRWYPRREFTGEDIWFCRVQGWTRTAGHN